jgi:Flp pilus assembly protein TadG
MILRFAPGSERSSVGIPTILGRRRCGVAAAELAILIPFLATLVAGMCEMGRAVIVKDILTNAARKGCRTGTTLGKRYQNVLDDVNSILSDNNLGSSNPTLTVQVASYTGNSTTPSWGPFTSVTSGAAFTPQPLDQILVRVSVPVSNVLWFSPVFMANKSIESETLIMVRQG